MLYTIINLDAVLNTENDEKNKQRARSSNPFDYIRNGYYLDNASLFGGSNNVSYNINNPGNSSGNSLDSTNK